MVQGETFTWQRIFKHTLFAFLFTLTFACLVNISFASDKIQSLDTKVVLNADASVTIQQVWQCKNSSGTEWFVPMYNLDSDSDIEDLKVSTGNREFTTLNDWDVNASFADKSYKCGLNEASKGKELCFGKSEKGGMTYNVSYKITHVLKKSKDGIPFLYFRFVNDKMKPAPKRASFAIDYHELGEKVQAKIWGFGFEADLKATKQAYTTEAFSFSGQHHITILLKVLNLPDTQMSALKPDNRTFNEIKDQAFQGSNYTNLDKSPNKQVEDKLVLRYNVPYKRKFFSHLFLLKAMPMSFLIFALSGLVALISSFVSISKTKPINLKAVKLDKKYYYRDIPFKGQIDLAEYFGEMIYGLTDDTQRGFIAAYILRWIKAGVIRPCKYQATKRFLLIKYAKEEEGLELVGEPECKEELERVTWMTIQLASDDNVLTAGELEAYANKHDTELSKAFKIALKTCKTTSLRQGLISFADKESSRISLTEAGIYNLQNLYGLKNYLRDFTIINERQAVEVGLWDNYLIFASIFGIAAKVEKEFKQLVPDYVFAKETRLDADGNFYNQLNYIYLANSFQRSFSSGISQAHSARSGGSGGFSSFGGGKSGFSGGGSGGGSR